MWGECWLCCWIDWDSSTVSAILKLCDLGKFCNFLGLYNVVGEVGITTLTLSGFVNYGICSPLQVSASRPQGSSYQCHLSFAGFTGQLHLLPCRNSACGVSEDSGSSPDARITPTKHLPRPVAPVSTPFLTHSLHISHELFVDPTLSRKRWNSILYLLMPYVSWLSGNYYSELGLVMEISPLSALSFLCEDHSFRLFPWSKSFWPTFVKHWEHARAVRCWRG